MGGEATAKCPCVVCGVNLEFPFESAGAEIDCPSCTGKTTLYVPEVAEAIPIAEVITAEPEQERAILTGKITPPKAGVLYQFGMVLVLLTMIILPIIYISLIGLAGWGVYTWATKGLGIFEGGGGGRILLIKAVIYVTPLFSGIVVVLFMIKPLLARRAQQPHPLALARDSAPELYELIEKICDTVGSPRPSRVDVDCQLNASASFRRGMVSFMGSDLVLTIGMPLVAGLSAQQLAGVLAHEFGHFTQGFGMRVTYLIRKINAWFARIAYERDSWDETLEEWGQVEDWRLSIVVNLARLAVWFSRLILKTLMYIGHIIGCFLLRQMEYDADSYAVKVAGSGTVESTMKRLHTLSASLQQAYKDMRVPWNNDRRLPDNFMKYFTQADAAFPAAKKVEIEDRVGLETSGLLDTHPADGDRIRHARLADEAGVLHVAGPASSLFNSYDGLCKQVTLLHYTEDMGIETELAKFYNPEPSYSSAATAPVAEPNPASPPADSEARPSLSGLRVKKTVH